MSVLTVVLAWWLGGGQLAVPAPIPCRDRPLVDGELPIGNGVVTAVTPTMFKIGSMTLTARMDTDAYRELLLFAREEIAVRVSLRLAPEATEARESTAPGAVFDRTAVLEDLGLMSGRTLRPALARLDEVELMVYSNRCLAQQVLKWAGRRVQLIARYDRASSDTEAVLTFVESVAVGL